MARYVPLSEVYPPGSMVTGAVVTAALCDQIRDNLVALHDGWWFRATTLAGFALGAGVGTPFLLGSITRSQSAIDDGSVSLNAGNVQIEKPGVWLVGAHFETASTTTTMLVSITSSDESSPVCQWIADTATGRTDLSCSGATEIVSRPATLQMIGFSSGGTTVQLSSRSPIFWGVWMSGNP